MNPECEVCKEKSGFVEYYRTWGCCLCPACEDALWNDRGPPEEYNSDEEDEDCF